LHGLFFCKYIKINEEKKVFINVGGFGRRSKIPLFTPSFLASHFFVGFPQASVGRFGKSTKNKWAAAKGFSLQSGLVEQTVFSVQCSVFSVQKAEGRMQNRSL
jgi:hypothetical protein